MSNDHNIFFNLHAQLNLIVWKKRMRHRPIEVERMVCSRPGLHGEVVVMVVGLACTHALLLGHDHPQVTFCLLGRW